jgi:deazaflavin-dependent oxidoreductase (nitroreductase family)
VILERSRLLKWIFQRVTQLQVRVYRWTGGRIWGKWKGGPPVLLLDHVGRKSGKHRVSPIVYTPSGDNLVVVASFGGAAKDPVWWLNLKANPRTWVQVGRDRREVVARLATPEEKADLWPKLCEVNSDYAKYQEKTDRDIPVVILSPARDGAAVPG